MIASKKRQPLLAYFAFNPQGFQIGLLGLMTAALPTAENTLAVVELGLRAWYSSIDAVLGVQLLVDPMSAQYLMGAEIDYKEDLQGAQFVIRNPNAKTTCGCGSSFSA